MYANLDEKEIRSAGGGGRTGSRQSGVFVVEVGGRRSGEKKKNYVWQTKERGGIRYNFLRKVKVREVLEEKLVVKERGGCWPWMLAHRYDVIEHV